MKIEDFYKAMANLSDEKRAEIIKAIEEDRLPSDKHVQWLAQWRNAREVSPNLPDDMEQQQQRAAAEERLSVLLATTPATTRASMVAQIEWFKEDLGGYVLGNATAAHDEVFDTLIKSARYLAA